MSDNLACQDEIREEIIGGKVVMMSSPTINHTFIAGNIYNIFFNFLRGKRCTPIMDGGGLYLEDGAEEYQPDMMVVCDPDKIRADGVHGAPDLVVEVLSPSTGWYDRGHKKDIYEKHGVREYWIVEPAGKSVEQYVLEGGRFVLRGVYAVYPDFMLKRMKPEEIAAIVTEFRCTLFDDLPIRLDDVFYRVKD